MRLENLYTNFGTASPEDQLAFIVDYRLRRAEDMTKPGRKSASVKTSKIDLSLTDEEKSLMKILGLRKKDMLLLRASTEVIEEPNDVALLTDSTFEEGEEE